jgi:hypothetical protein
VSKGASKEGKAEDVPDTNTSSTSINARNIKQIVLLRADMVGWMSNVETSRLHGYVELQPTRSHNAQNPSAKRPLAQVPGPNFESTSALTELSRRTATPFVSQMEAAGQFSLWGGLRDGDGFDSDGCTDRNHTALDFTGGPKL